MKKLIKILSISYAIIILTNCSNDALYKEALFDAAIIETSEIIEIPAIKNKKLKVVTWTGYPSSYKVGKKVALKWGEVWVTLDGDVKARCQKMSRKSLSQYLKKLLGLPLKNNKERSFVTLEVNAYSLFRPCANPDITSNKCLPNFPKNVSTEHRKWYSNTVSNSYIIPNGYPWTRLGYTYNWNLGESEVGPVEFVIKKGEIAKVISVSNTKTYCTKVVN